MSKLFDRQTVKFLGKVVLIALLIIFVIRVFWFELISISTNQMEASLVEGDEILVNKIAYGPRLPITPLAVPFVGNKCYSDLIQLPYKRIFSSSVDRNDIVVFNNPTEIETPTDKQSLLISRCIAIPGDTIIIRDGVYYLNGKEYVHAPTKVDRYYASLSDNEVLKVAVELDILPQNKEIKGDTLFFELNRYEAFLLKQHAAEGSFIKENNVALEPLAFIVPANGQAVLLSDNNVRIYRHIIEREMKDKVVFKDGETYIDGEKIEVYTFKDDYYWMLSDNTVEGIDSRILGFIPFKSIVGRASIILYSYSRSEGLKTDRIFKLIN